MPLCEAMLGRFTEVPGRGMAAMAFSSITISAIPSSSTSVSSIQFCSVSARVLINHTAWGGVEGVEGKVSGGGLCVCFGGRWWFSSKVEGYRIVARIVADSKQLLGWSG
jgi:hypothetical protein